MHPFHPAAPSLGSKNHAGLSAQSGSIQRLHPAAPSSGSIQRLHPAAPSSQIFIGQPLANLRPHLSNVFKVWKSKIWDRWMRWRWIYLLYLYYIMLIYYIWLYINIIFLWLLYRFWGNGYECLFLHLGSTVQKKSNTHPTFHITKQNGIFPPIFCKF
jgi:hypothetical protein